MNKLNKFYVNFFIILFGFFLQNPSFGNPYEYAVMGDAGEWNSDTRSIYQSLLRKNVRTLVMPGDNLYSWPWSPKSYADVWFPWRLGNFNFFAVAIGNHHGGYETEIKYFEMPGEYYSRTQDGVVKFIVLNSDNAKNVSEQAKFLEKELIATSTPFTFIVYHHPTYTVSLFHSSAEKANFQYTIRPILKKYRSKITALLVGHDHLSLVAHFDDLPVILSGSSHEQRFHIPYTYTADDGTEVVTNWFNSSSPLWAYLHIEKGASIAYVDYTRGYDDVVKCSLSIETGKSANFMSNCFD